MMLKRVWTSTCCLLKIITTSNNATLRGYPSSFEHYGTTIKLK